MNQFKAIGTGEVATAKDAQEVCAAFAVFWLRNLVQISLKKFILYGGSVKSSTIVVNGTS